MNSMPLQYLRGLGTDSLVTAVMVVGLIMALLYRRYYIEDRRLFRLAAVLLAGAIAIPPFLSPVISFYVMSNQGMARQVEMPILVAVMTNAVGPVLTGCSLICAVNSIIPRSFAPPEPLVPSKHPLDA